MGLAFWIAFRTIIIDGTCNSRTLLGAEHLLLRLPCEWLHRFLSVAQNLNWLFVRWLFVRHFSCLRRIAWMLRQVYGVQQVCFDIIILWALTGREA